VVDFRDPQLSSAVASARPEPFARDSECVPGGRPIMTLDQALAFAIILGTFALI
jgi:hypothetical protein